MTMQWLFFEFRGRINRKIYIFAFLFLFCLQIGSSYLLLRLMGLSIQTYLAKVTTYTLTFDFISNLIFFWPTLAIGVKRLQDIGWSGGGYFFVYSALILTNLLGALGTFSASPGGSTEFKSLVGMLALGSLAFFVIMVFFPGSKGKNGYGAEPL